MPPFNPKVADESEAENMFLKTPGSCQITDCGQVKAMEVIIKPRGHGSHDALSVRLSSATSHSDPPCNWEFRPPLACYSFSVPNIRPLSAVLSQPDLNAILKRVGGNTLPRGDPANVPTGRLVFDLRRISSNSGRGTSRSKP